MNKMYDFTKHAIWTEDCGGKQDLDFDVLSVSTRYWPDFSARVAFLAEGQTRRDERGIMEAPGYDPILDSGFIYGESEEDVKYKVREWINRNASVALEKMVSRAKL